MLQKYDVSSVTEEDLAEGINGFTGSECDELLAQGVKPWDDAAYDVMNFLDGY